MIFLFFSLIIKKVVILVILVFEFSRVFTIHNKNSVFTFQFSIEIEKKNEIEDFDIS